MLHVCTPGCSSLGNAAPIKCSVHDVCTPSCLWALTKCTFSHPELGCRYRFVMCHCIMWSLARPYSINALDPVWPGLRKADCGLHVKVHLSIHNVLSPLAPPGTIFLCGKHACDTSSIKNRKCCHINTSAIQQDHVTYFSCAIKKGILHGVMFSFFYILPSGCCC